MVVIGVVSCGILLFILIGQWQTTRELTEYRDIRVAELDEDDCDRLYLEGDEKVSKLDFDQSIEIFRNGR